MHEREENEHSSRFLVISLMISALLLLLSLFWLKEEAQLIACIAAYLLAGWPVLKEAGENLFHGEIFDENFLMSVASLGAFALREYPEAVAVMLLYQIGEFLQDKAVDSSRDAIKALLALRPEQVIVLSGETINAADVTVGTKIIVRPGDRFPLDGKVFEGTSLVDTSPLTGESLPQRYTVGDTVLAGCINLDGRLTVEVTKPFSQSSVSRMMSLVEEAQERKAKPEQFITRFARIYTPVVCGIALLVAALPPLFGWGAWASCIHRALSFLVISCPCALVISVPLTFFSGIGSLSHQGILCKGGSELELLSKANVAAFDKTGTLTAGKFSVTKFLPVPGVGDDTLLEVAAYCESQSTHPLGRAICEAYSGVIDSQRLGQITEQAGQGICAILDGKRALAGNLDLLENIPVNAMLTPETAVFVAWDGKYLGCITLADVLKPGVKATLEGLRKMGFHHLTMLSGDRQAAVLEVAEKAGLDQAYWELLPEQKVQKLKELQTAGTVLYAGDGINDAPVLAAADVGVAMGGLGSDAAIETADVVIMSDEPGRIGKAVWISRKTMKIARENIIFSIVVKVLILMVSLWLNPGLWLAVLADVGVCLLAVLNALRTLRIR